MANADTYGTSQGAYLCWWSNFIRDKKQTSLLQLQPAARVCDADGERNHDEPAEDDREEPEEICWRQPPGHQPSGESEQRR